MVESQVKNKKTRYGRASKAVTMKLSPNVWEKFKVLVEREQLTYGLALEIMMSEAIERGYIVKAREKENYY